MQRALSCIAEKYETSKGNVCFKLYCMRIRARDLYRQALEKIWDELLGV